MESLGPPGLVLVRLAEGSSVRASAAALTREAGRRLRRAELHPPLHAGSAQRPSLRGALGPEPDLGRRHRRAGGLGDDDGKQHRDRRRDRQRRRLRTTRTSPGTSGSTTTIPATTSTTTATASSTTSAAGTSSQDDNDPARLQRPRDARGGHDRRGRQQRARRHRRQPGRRDHAAARRRHRRARRSPTSSRRSTTPATNGADVVNGSFGGPDKSLAHRQRAQVGPVPEHALRLRGRERRRSPHEQHRGDERVSLRVPPARAARLQRPERRLRRRLD